jgi:hypothetical protein
MRAASRPPPNPQALAVLEAASRAQTLLSSAELARVVGISAAALDGLVRVGIVEATAAGGDEFSAATAVRLKRILRLHHDLELDLFGAVIVVDLLERLERADAELTRLRAQRETGEG